MAKLGDDEEHILDESMPFLFEKLGDLTALTKHRCLTIAQCVLLLPAYLTEIDPDADATEAAAHRLMLAMLDVSAGKLAALHPDSMLPWSQYLRMIESGMFGTDGLNAPMVTPAWLVTLEECERWHRANGAGVDCSGLKSELEELSKRRVEAAAVSMQERKTEEAKTEIRYQFPMYARLEPRTQWKGGRITETDKLTLDDAAKFASKHAGTEITPADFLRAAARGEITLRAVAHRDAKLKKHDGGIYCNAGEATENTIPKNAIPNLPLSACQQLATTGQASWRTLDGFELVDGILMRFTVATLLDGEPDFQTVLADCLVTGDAVHALADAYIGEPAPEATPTADEIAPPAVSVPLAARITTHRIETRSNILSPIIEMAKQTASSPGNYQSVWAELVKLADSANRPAPLIGYSDGEGVKYQDSIGVKFFTKDALKKRMKRSGAIAP